MKNPKTVFVIMGSIAIALLVNGCSSIRPVAWQPNKKPLLKGEALPHKELKSVEKISLNGWYGPEDILFDRSENLYCGVHRGDNDFSDGKILKISPSGKVEVFYDAGSWVAGLHFDTNGNLIALSHRQGLISIDSQKNSTVLADKDSLGRRFLIPNGLDIARDGAIYFTNTSYNNPYSIKYGRKLILEMRPDGGLYKYDPVTQKVRTLIDGLYFGNGIVLSQDESFLLVAETIKYRVLKYWLKGKKAGKTEIFLDNLPGFPNGISIRADGSFWLGFTTKRNDALDKIHPSPMMKKLVYALPNWLQPKQDKVGMILNVSENGAVLTMLLDPIGQQIPEAGAVKELNGNLFIGGDNLPYIGRYHLQ